MKFKVGDQVLITAGKDKGKKGTIERVLPRENKVVVTDLNQYVRHVRKMGTTAGQKMILSRPLHTAKIAIINDQGNPDRIGYRFDKDDKKIRIYKKTGQEIVIAAKTTAKATAAAKDKKVVAKKDELSKAVAPKKVADKSDKNIAKKVVKISNKSK